MVAVTNLVENAYVFEDEYGVHSHSVLTAPPYDPNAPLTCVSCCARMNEFRSGLVARHGWSKWPEDCSVVKMS